MGTRGCGAMSGFPAAAQPDIIRAVQKDEVYVRVSFDNHASPSLPCPARSTLTERSALKSNNRCSATPCWTPRGDASTPGRWSGTSKTSGSSRRCGTTASPPGAGGRRSARSTSTCFNATRTESSREPRGGGSSCCSRRSPRRSWNARGYTRGGYRRDASGNGTKRTSRGGETTRAIDREDADQLRTVEMSEASSRRRRRHHRSTRTRCGTPTGSARCSVRLRRGWRGRWTTRRWRCSIPRRPRPEPTSARRSSPNPTEVSSLGSTSRRSTRGDVTIRRRNGSRGCGTCSPGSSGRKAGRGTGCWGCSWRRGWRQTRRGPR